MGSRRLVIVLNGFILMMLLTISPFYNASAERKPAALPAIGIDKAIQAQQQIIKPEMTNLETKMLSSVVNIRFSGSENWEQIQNRVVSESASTVANAVFHESSRGEKTIGSLKQAITPSVHLGKTDKGIPQNLELKVRSNTTTEISYTGSVDCDIVYNTSDAALDVRISENVESLGAAGRLVLNHKVSPSQQSATSQLTVSWEF